ncbi:hypothetical protein [Thauera sp. SDU_THAU2]|uniref:hypothetical protein n=1 Tax=Thauera sp. SDU_THAU2 TaxID=3136633 RepID=UPI00312045C6
MLLSPAFPSVQWLSTEQLAAALHLKPQSLRAAICRSGHYFGLQPCKMLNGRLLWPADSLDRLAADASPAAGSNLDCPDLATPGLHGTQKQKRQPRKTGVTH